MSPVLFASLVKVLNDWVLSNANETDDWPDFWVGDKLALNMAKAAKAVFNAAVDSQKSAKSNGYMDDTQN